MTKEAANAVYDLLVAEAGAGEGWRLQFVFHQTERYCTEFRFMGALGFGGKFWRNWGYRSDGSWGETWYVNAYPEDLTDERRALIDRVNTELDGIRQALGEAVP